MAAMLTTDLNVSVTDNWTVSTVKLTSPSENLFDVLSTVIHFSTIYSFIQSTVGCVCNAMCFLVLSRKSFRNSNISLYLRFLSVTDFSALLNNLVRNSVMSATGFDIYESNSGCQTWMWFSNVSVLCSSWTLVAVTIERVIFVTLPYTAQHLCTKTKAKIVIFSIFIIWVALLTNFALQFGTVEQIDPETNETSLFHCVFSNMPQDIILSSDDVFTLIGVAWSFLPSIILVISNFVIVVALRKNTKLRKNMGSNDKTGDSRTAKETSMTVTLFCINVCYVVCNFPLAIFSVTPEYLTPSGGEAGGILLNITFTLLVLLMYTNNALNFFLYFATGSKFRRELKAIMKEVSSLCK